MHRARDNWGENGGRGGKAARGVKLSGRAMHGACASSDKGRLASLHVPLLIVHGEEETIPMDLIEEWVTAMPKGAATLLKVPRVAHFPYLERPEIVWPAVEKFLATP